MYEIDCVVYPVSKYTNPVEMCNMLSSILVECLTAAVMITV